MRFWFTDVGSSETQMCRLARAFAVRIMKQNLPFEPAHSQGLHVSLFPWGGRGEQRDDIGFVPPFPLKFGLCSPVSLKWIPFTLFPKTPTCRSASDFVTYHTYWYCDDTGLYDFFTFDSFLVNYYLYLHFCGFFQRKHNRGDLRHKTNFRFFGERGRKPNYCRGTKTLLENKLGNIRKPIFDFGDQGNKPTKEQVPPSEECVALYPGSQVDTRLVQSDSKPSPYDLRCWWNVKYKLNQSIKPGIVFFQTPLNSLFQLRPHARYVNNLRSMNYKASH